MSEIKEYVKYDDLEDRLYVHRVQDVEPIIEANKAQFDPDNKRYKSDAMNHVARIPLIVFEEHYKKTGENLMTDQKALRRFLNDPDNRFFRTKPGKL